MPRYDPRTFIRLGDTIDKCVERGAQIRLSCSDHPLAGDCGHSSVMDAVDLAELCTKRHWPRTLIEIGKHLICIKCGKNWPHLTVVGQ